MLDNGSARTVVHKVGIVHKKDDVGPDLARTGNRRSILQIGRQIPEGDCLRGLGSRQCGKYTGRQRLGGGEAASVFRNVSLLHKSNLFRVPAVIFLQIGHFTTPAHAGRCTNQACPTSLQFITLNRHSKKTAYDIIFI